MKNNNPKILVLSDMKSTSDKVLKNTLELAKLVNGSVSFFHVKKPTDVVERESQLSAVRTINEKYIATDKEIKSLIDSVSENDNTKITYNYAFGNIKEEIKTKIDETKPDIVVLGKRKPKVLNFIGDNVTDFVLDKHNGAVMIASEHKVLEAEKDLSLGILNQSDKGLENPLTQNLIEKTNRPLKSFAIGKNQNAEGKAVSTLGENAVEYVFEDSSNTMKTIADYIDRNDINLVCVDRATSKSSKRNYAKDAIGKLNVSLLVT